MERWIRKGPEALLVNFDDYIKYSGLDYIFLGGCSIKEECGGFRQQQLPTQHNHVQISELKSGDHQYSTYEADHVRSLGHGDDDRDRCNLGNRMLDIAKFLFVQRHVGGLRSNTDRFWIAGSVFG